MFIHMLFQQSFVWLPCERDQVSLCNVAYQIPRLPPLPFLFSVITEQVIAREAYGWGVLIEPFLTK